MLYYMAVRYEGSGEPDLELSESIPSSGPFFGKKSTLYVWHLQDTTDAWEKRRNNRIFSWQNNRNPFIDHPEFAERLPSISGIPIPAGGPEIIVSPENIDLGTVTPNDSVSYYFAVLNSGTAELTVSEISCSHSNFMVDKISLELEKDAYEFIKLTYATNSGEGTFSTLLNISSNDEDEGQLQIPVTVNVSPSTSIGTEGGRPDEFILYPNFPNPFNPETKIRYYIPSKNHVRITVHDILGRQISVLVNQEMTAGTHGINFRAEGLSSGIYYCRVKYGQHIKVHKIVLLQ